MKTPCGVPFREVNAPFQWRVEMNCDECQHETDASHYIRIVSALQTVSFKMGASPILIRSGTPTQPGKLLPSYCKKSPGDSSCNVRDFK